MKRKKTKTAISPRHALSLFNPHLQFVFACLFLLFIFNCLLQASDARKTRHAIIFGTVWGPDDRPLPGVEVKIRRANEKKARWDLYSSRRGEFEVAVPAGKSDYVIWAVTRHYKSPEGRHFQPSPQVTVHIENDERADTGLHLK